MANPNPFGDFEQDFKNTAKADPAASPGRIPPGTYKFVLTSAENKEQVLADHEIFTTPQGTKAFKVYCEVCARHHFAPRSRESRVRHVTMRATEAYRSVVR